MSVAMLMGMPMSERPPDERPERGYTPGPAAPRRSRFVRMPVDDASLGPPRPIAYLLEPYLPEKARVWLWGPPETAKSLWALSVSCRLSREGLAVTYFSEENPEAEDARRLRRLPRDPDRLRFYHGQGVDLLRDRDDVLAAADGSSLVVFDTLTACWSDDENDNRAIAVLDRDALQPVVRAGATVLMIHNTGHAGVRPRSGIAAGRGASAMGDKADVVLQARRSRAGTFEITHAKNRFGGDKEPRRTYSVVDTPDGILDIRQLATGDQEVSQLANDIFEAIEREPDGITTKNLRARVGGSREKFGQAIELLLREDPPRVTVTEEMVGTPGGPQHARVWRLAT